MNQKWVPDKIPHRNDNSIFLSTIFLTENQMFPLKKKTLKLFFSELKKNKTVFHFKMKIVVEKKWVTKRSNYHFDVRICQESIFGTHKCNGSLKIALRQNTIFSEKYDNLLCYLGKPKTTF